VSRAGPILPKRFHLTRYLRSTRRRHNKPTRSIALENTTKFYSGEFAIRLIVATKYLLQREGHVFTVDFQ
jgi:hypothetical protein